jgi:hypothetical protein
MTRKAWITSDPFDLEAVARRLQAGDVTVAREGDEYYLTSPDIDAAADDQEANDIGAKIIGRINALGSMGDPNFRLVKLSRYTNEAGQNVVVGRMGPTLATVRTHATATVTQPDGTAADSPPSPWPTYLDLANTNEHVARVQEIIGREEPLGWVELYKVHEIIRRDIEPKKLHETDWTTKERDRAFTASADRYDVSGDDARHAVDKHAEPPKSTIPINEGRSYISDLVKQWLDWLAQR